MTAARGDGAALRFLWLAGLLAVAASASCRSHRNPGTCRSQGDCGAGERCDVPTRRCLPADAAAAADGLADHTPEGSGGDVASPDAPDAGGDASTGTDADASGGGDASDGGPSTCSAAGDCAGTPFPVCDLSAGKCVECMGDTHCSAPRPVCMSNVCVGCTLDTHCMGAAPICDKARNSCVGCMADGECRIKSAATPACANGRCVACSKSQHCPLTTPICNGNACRRCLRDAECSEGYGPDPGVCRENDGRCASDADVIYLQNRVECSTSARGDGTAVTPFCFSSDAAAELSAERDVIVVRGPRDKPLDPLDLTFTGAPVLVVGQNGARIAPPNVGSPPLFTMLGGDVTVRDLEIGMGNGAGVLASGGVLRMTRCLVTLNRRAGIDVENAAFDISNTVIARNGGTTDPGVRLGAAAAGPQVFRNNTVLENGFGGVSCASSYQLVGSVFVGNAVVPFGPTCVATDACALACSAIAPAFDATFHYQASAPAACIDVLDSAPATDRDGEPRPRGARSDCGADELNAN
jgi:hypothetical protein